MSKEIIELLVQMRNTDITKWLETEKEILDHLREQPGMNGESLKPAYDALVKKIEEEIERLKKS